VTKSRFVEVVVFNDPLSLAKMLLWRAIMVKHDKFDLLMHPNDELEAVFGEPLAEQDVSMHRLRAFAHPTRVAFASYPPPPG
jgi:hypothetical protein